MIYAKAPFAGAHNVVEYLGRYTHKIAISNHRIVAINDKEVTFAYKDYADKAKKKQMALSPQEFIRRFALHILPSGFRRIRHFGFLANAAKTKALPKARAALKSPPKKPSTSQERKELAIKILSPKQDLHKCPRSEKGIFQP